MTARGVIDKFLTFFGDIKIFSFPMFFIYDPDSYRVKGEDVHKLISTVRYGDILVRGFKNYLDGLFHPGLFQPCRPVPRAGGGRRPRAGSPAGG
jgi:hypothetical protein